ncbi:MULTISPECIES: hypothetical protein [Haloprofundus]|uniref:hypothetical protein n=1 Tax=Haloprofundus TaxID=1911573 RepID=UPI001300B239|nr:MULTISPECIES: hypothetical protein [Haloprofundus]
MSGRHLDSEVGTDLGVADENIERAAWFEELPEETFDRKFAEAVLSKAESKKLSKSTV